jgi:hypothetical protein
MAEKKEQVLVERLAALMYMDVKPDKRAGLVPFDQLTEAEQQPHIDKAARILAMLDKLGLIPLPPPDKKAQNVSREQRLDTLTDLIEGFFKGIKVLKAGCIPGRELAARIIDSGV